MTPEQFIQNHFPGLEKETWYPTIVAIAEGYSKALTAEVERLRELIKETAMRTNIAFPTNEKQIEWFEEGLVVTKSGDFINRLFKECEFIDPQALAPERKEVGNV